MTAPDNVHRVAMSCLMLGVAMALLVAILSVRQQDTAPVAEPVPDAAPVLPPPPCIREHCHERPVDGGAR